MNDKNVKESTEYDNFVGKTSEEEKPPTLETFLGVDPTDVVEEKEWQKHWTAMPEYEQKDNPTHKTIYVHFRSEADYQEFAKMIGQNLTEKTKSIWHPALDRAQNSLMRWIEDDES